MRKRETRKNVKKIVVTFGGTDPTNKTQNIIKLIDNFELKNIQWNFILGLGHPVGFVSPPPPHTHTAILCLPLTYGEISEP